MLGGPIIVSQALKDLVQKDKFEEFSESPGDLDEVHVPQNSILFFLSEVLPFVDVV